MTEKQGMEEILNIIMFENWLRFYFIREDKPEGNKEPKLQMKIPENALDKIKNLYPAYLPLAEKMNNRNVDFETSRECVITHIFETLDGKKLEKGAVEKIFSGAGFQVQLQMFHTWTQLHEDQLDRSFLDFGAWQNLFNAWKATGGAEELAKKLEESSRF